MTDDKSDGDISTIKDYIDEMIDALSVKQKSENVTKDVRSPSSPKRPTNDRLGQLETPRLLANEIGSVPAHEGNIYAQGNEPPDGYRRHKKQDESPLGPITGKMVALGYALHRNKSLTDQSYRDQFHKSVKNGAIWVRKSDSEPRKLEMFIRATSSSKADADADQKKLNHCKAMVNEFESRPKPPSKGNQSEPKSNKAT